MLGKKSSLLVFARAPLQLVKRLIVIMCMPAFVGV